MRSIIGGKRRVGELTRLPVGMYRAFLAEPYDGIGQYVMVGNSRSTTGSGYKGRIASGDFGGGRTFPLGTPVLVRSYHGELEVFLGNLPGCKCREDFDREEATGWGTGPFGTWTNPEGNPVDFYTDGQYGWYDLGGTDNATNNVVLAEPLELPVEVVSEFIVRGDDPFTTWSGAGAGTSEWNYQVLIDTGYFGAHRGGAQLFLSGTAPATTLVIVDDEQRSPSGTVEAFETEFDFDLTSQELGPYGFRVYMDDYGSYARYWLKEEGEDSSSGKIPFTGTGNEAAWSNTGGGKGESWQAYQVALSGYTGNFPLVALTVGGFGRHAHGGIESICGALGIPCQ